MKFTPQNCPHCEYDRRFPHTDMGGWIYFGNNGPFVPCGLCNPDGSHPRISAEECRGPEVASQKRQT